MAELAEVRLRRAACRRRWLGKALRGLLVVAVGQLPSIARAAPDPLGLVPSVRNYARAGGSVRLANRCELSSDQPERDAYALLVLTGALAESRSVGGKPSTPGVPAVRHVHLRCSAVDALPSDVIQVEGYAIEVRADSVVITGSTPAARLHGAATLRQLLHLDGGRVARGKILDGPTLAIRAYSLDISRGRLPDRLEFIRVLDLCAAFKLNTILIYIEDTYAFTRIPRAALRGYALSAPGLAELAVEARRRSIDLVPVVETLGHQERLLAHSSMRGFAERFASRSAWQQFVFDARAWLERRYDPSTLAESDRTGASSMFATTDPKTQSLLCSMVDDVLASSGSKNVHIGCDEPAELGQGASAAACESRGAGAVFAEHVRVLSEHARRRWGATTWIFDDFILAHPEILEQLPREVVLVDWHYDPEAAFGSLDSLMSGRPRQVVTSAGLWNWHAGYPDYSRSLPSIRSATSAARSHGCLGSMLASWGDGGAEDLFGNDVLGLAYFASCAWSSEAADPGAFLHRYCRLRFGAAGDSLVPLYRVLADLGLPNGGTSQRLIDRPVIVRRRTPVWTAAVRELQFRLATAARALGWARPTDVYADAELQAMGCAVDRILAAADRELTLDSLAIVFPRGERARAGSAGVRAVTSLARLRHAEESAQFAYVTAWRQHNEESELASVRARFRARLQNLDSLRACAVVGTLSVPARYRE